jgi:hypothetical protein
MKESLLRRAFGGQAGVRRVAEESGIQNPVSKEWDDRSQEPGFRIEGWPMTDDGGSSANSASSCENLSIGDFGFSVCRRVGVSAFAMLSVTVRQLRCQAAKN